MLKVHGYLTSCIVEISLYAGHVFLEHEPKTNKVDKINNKNSKNLNFVFILLIISCLKYLPDKPIGEFPPYRLGHCEHKQGRALAYDMMIGLVPLLTA